MRFIALLWAAFLFAACTTPPVVYAPDDLEGQPPTGAVTPLSSLLPRDGGLVTLVFIHGVGDHCYGYALDPESGWLNDKKALQIGFRPTSALSSPSTINVNVFMGGDVDVDSYVQYGLRSFSLNIEGVPQQVPVTAVEIDWSHLTQWIKSNQLGYDGPVSLKAKGSQDCVTLTGMNVPAIKRPPSRLLGDRIIKEQVFDRDLADAIIYSGTYGPVLERGVADALCHAVTKQPDNVHCAWPNNAVRAKSKFFFVTHSLGSRILYDAILNLLGYDTDARPNPFTKEEQENSSQFVQEMLATTPAIYMMANQLALIGLANVPTRTKSVSGIHPFSVRQIASIAPTAVSGTVEATHCHNILAAVSDARVRAGKSLGYDIGALKVIAFNDTNDLLTWPIPEWYANSGPTDNDCRPEIELTNVFVQNSPHLFVIESPAAAHDDYFINQQVWEVIACGAKQGSKIPCR